MVNNYSIAFVSLRGEFTYTVHIGGGSGTEVPLKGGSSPFVTQEDDSEDMFTNIRTQSGYIRIVDDGRDANGNAFDWKDLIPATDTSRPVTLTRRVNNTNVVMWRGFMQAQDFGSALYGNPQEREFPIQCVLTVTQGADINYQHTDIENFAYLLLQIVDSIPSAQRPSNFVIQGGADARSWLMKKIDWQNFVSEDANGLTARFSMYQCLEDMCRFWGWTARTCGTTMYLTCADDSAEQTFLTLTYGQLGQLAVGTTAGDTTGTFSTVDFDTIGASYNIFANTGQEEYVQRGYNKALVSADTNRGDDDILDVFDDDVVKTMEGKSVVYPAVHGVYYTEDLLEVDENLWGLQCRSGYASLNIGSIAASQGGAEYINVIRIKKTGGNNVTPFVQMQTTYAHNYSGGFLMMFGKTYRFNEEYLDPFGNFSIGRSYMYARIGIGPTRESAKWWNGQSWQNSLTYCRISIGNKENSVDKKDEFCFLYLQQREASSDDWGTNILPINNLYGHLYFDLLGTNDSRVSAIDGEKSFELNDIKISYFRNAGVLKQGSASEFYKVEEISRPNTFEYKSSNNNAVRNEWSADCIYATENGCEFCYGEIFDTNGALITTVPYGNTTERPEQHLANRVTSFWARSRRRLRTELLANVAMVGSTLIRDITPQYLVTMDGVQCHPLAISHDWRDDIVQLTMLDIEN